MTNLGSIFNIVNKALGLETAEDVRNIFEDIKVDDLEEVAGLSAIFACRPVKDVALSLLSIYNPLMSLETLTELNFSDNAVGAQFLPIPYTSSRRDDESSSPIKLSNNGLGPEAGNAVARSDQGIRV
ncbi:hypothetical protein M422DRAFT_51713 [Sphaerobolus stellatus SS14]|uniref:Uncharacterized protein n=1 Tax=Sphaerobolus stellatus (strain SS14) TaxID=990650 RepID=A0A0C9V051_SPHS4|nr:hypothetical protein M422DRAFT_51713 [Sphaerobolus stellatus SS14]